MRFSARVSIGALVVAALIALSAGPVQAAEHPGIETFVAASCEFGFEECGNEIQEAETVFGEQEYSVPTEPTEVKQSELEGFRKAGGHVPFGVTDFKIDTVGEHGGPNELPNEVPTAVVKHIRTDVAPGLATNPLAIPTCSSSEFGKEALPGTGFFEKPACEESTEIGENLATVYAGEGVGDVSLSGPVFNLEPKPGRTSLFGVALELPIPLTKGALEKAFAEKGHPFGTPTEEFLEKKQYWAHTLIEGDVEWGAEAAGTGQGDYHDYYEINVSTALPLISSRLVLFGTAGGDFITNATSCPGHNTTTLKIEDAEGKTVERPYTTLVGLDECENVPFNPGFSVTHQASTASDAPDALTVKATLAHNTGESEIDDSQVKSATIALPEGVTLNASAAAGLEACTPAQARIHSEQFGVECPEGSKLGTVVLNVPGLPPESLTGSIYLGGPESGPITGPPYVMYIVANSERYDVSVRLMAEVIPNEATGQLTAVFPNPPEQPFSELVMTFDRTTLAPTANALVCGKTEGSAHFVPYSGFSPKEIAFGVSVTGCEPTLPFSLSQSTQDEPATAGAHGSYTFSLARASGQQYLHKIKTTLPEGLVGAIPLVTLCGEPQAAEGTCPASSKIGTATVTAGAGGYPFTFTGPVYMTGPYEKAPFGMSVAVPAVAGPFNLGTVVTRSAISINESTARVTAESTLPTIVKGVPLRLRSLSVVINKQGFLFNPTNCSPLATETTLTSTFGAIQEGLSSPFQAENCGALAFKPSFSAATGGKPTKEKGASIETTLGQPGGQANVKSVLVQLPKQLPSRLSTLQKACPEATFVANPFACPAGSVVGSARANTPTLPVKMTGPAIFVSHGGEAFPDLDLVLEGDGVRVIVVGKTNIKGGITTTDFATVPDVPVSSITVSLPMATNSALAANGNLCAPTLVMPTTITAQNGAVFKQNTKIAPVGCGVQIVGHKVIGNTAYLTVKTFSAGTITGSGSSLATVRRKLNAASNATALKVKLSARGRKRHKPFKVKLKVSFTPKKGARSSATVTVRF